MRITNKSIFCFFFALFCIITSSVLLLAGNQNRIAFTDYEGKLHLLNTETLEIEMIPVTNRDSHAKDSRGNLAFIPALSPDGTNVAFCNIWGVYVMDLATQKVVFLSDQKIDSGNNGAGWGILWSPDSKKLGFLGGGGNPKLFFLTINLDTHKLVSIKTVEHFPVAWFSENRLLCIKDREQKEKFTLTPISGTKRQQIIYTITPEGKEKKILRETLYDESEPRDISSLLDSRQEVALSPDKTKFIYLKKGDIFVSDIDGKNRRRIVSHLLPKPDGGSSDQGISYFETLLWSPDTKKIFYFEKSPVYNKNRDGWEYKKRFRGLGGTARYLMVINLDGSEKRMIKEFFRFRF